MTFSTRFESHWFIFRKTVENSVFVSYVYMNWFFNCLPKDESMRSLCLYVCLHELVYAATLRTPVHVNIRYKNWVFSCLPKDEPTRFKTKRKRQKLKNLLKVLTMKSVHFVGSCCIIIHFNHWNCMVATCTARFNAVRLLHTKPSTTLYSCCMHRQVQQCMVATCTVRYNNVWLLHAPPGTTLYGCYMHRQVQKCKVATCPARYNTVWLLHAPSGTTLYILHVKIMNFVGHYIKYGLFPCTAFHEWPF